MKITLSFLLGAAVLVAATALLTIQLTGQAVEDRVHGELERMVGLLSGRGFPLGDEALARVSDLIDADVVAVDAVGARFETDHQTALRRLDSSGVTLTTTEAALFEWCQVAGSPEFKQISQLIRQPPPEDDQVTG